MSDDNRFSNLEEKRPLPEAVKSAIARLDRFGALEIGGFSPALRPAAPAPAPSNRALCPSCGQANETDRTHCWACFKAIRPAEESPRKPQPGQEIELVLDGVPYRSSDPNLPDDVKALIDRIREEGYTAKLLQEWQTWRAVRNMPGRPRTKFDPQETRDRVEVVDGRYVDIIRIDNVMYRSDDPQLSTELKEIFDYINREGVTPALMQHLRLYGPKVRFRPVNTPTPSDGDLDFWGAARKFFRND